MSAFICKPVHIATCAAIIMESVKFDDPKPSAASIAVELARENIISVRLPLWTGGKSCLRADLKSHYLNPGRRRLETESNHRK